MPVALSNPKQNHDGQTEPFGHLDALAMKEVTCSPARDKKWNARHPWFNGFSTVPERLDATQQEIVPPSIHQYKQSAGVAIVASPNRSFANTCKGYK